MPTLEQFKAALETYRINRDSASAAMEVARLAYLDKCTLFDAAQEAAHIAICHIDSDRLAREAAVVTARSNMNTALATWQTAIATHQTQVNAHDVFISSIFTYLGV